MLGNAADTVYGDPSYEVDVDSYLSQIAPNMGALVVDNARPGESWADTAMRLIPAILGTQQQIELLRIQTDRARAGLPPLDLTGYSGLGVNVGVNASTQKAVLIGVGILAGAYLLPRLLGR